MLYGIKAIKLVETTKMWKAMPIRKRRGGRPRENWNSAKICSEVNSLGQYFAKSTSFNS